MSAVIFCPGAEVAVVPPARRQGAGDERKGVVAFFDRSSGKYVVELTGDGQRRETVQPSRLKLLRDVQQLKFITDDGSIVSSIQSFPERVVLDFFQQHGVLQDNLYIADIHALMKHMAVSTTPLKLSQLCGTEDFTWTLSYDPRFYAQLVFEGFLPIATDVGGVIVVLPKLHAKRCLLPLGSAPSESRGSQLHVPKKARKQSKKYTLMCNFNLNEVIRGCIKQHGTNWLYKPIRFILRALAALNVSSSEPTPKRVNWTKNSILAGRSVRAVAFELRRISDSSLVAGELGLTYGSTYLSLSGFHAENGAGTVQLVALGVWLQKQGFQLWDLGMGINYKLKLGATMVPRVDFVELHRQHRNHSNCQLSEGECHGATTSLLREHCQAQAQHQQTPAAAKAESAAGSK